MHKVHKQTDGKLFQRRLCRVQETVLRVFLHYFIGEMNSLSYTNNTTSFHTLTYSIIAMTKYDQTLLYIKVSDLCSLIGCSEGVDNLEPCCS